ncbi:hypothetical protein C7212DRAFT_321153 [Tuber magnatum]|uniref:Uncharacterized protein n=1 Tax=Tuber magnatum TaxID=42249 RepID=A0A317SR37_9PEZI|nr:hypothetical protein C7212DRAFT_321153 [Tuber magnatum]
MGNLCSYCQSIRKIEIEIGELRNDVARLARDREPTGVAVEGGRTVAGGGAGGGMRSQAAVATTRGSRAAGHRGGLRGPWNSKAVEELEAKRRREKSARRDRS